MTRHPYSRSRRRFLHGASVFAAAGMVPGVQVMRSARAASGSPRTLIPIHLAGGNDTLNTVIPYQDPLYYSIRQGLAIPKQQVLELTDRQGLHPSLAGLKSLYDANKVAIVNGVGYPAFDYSHFEAMQIYWQADPNRAQGTGWLGRALDRVAAGTLGNGGVPDVLTGATIGYGSSPSLIARTVTAPLLAPDPGSFRLPATGVRERAALTRILRQPATGTNFVFDAFLRNNNAALRAFDTVQRAGALTTTVRYPDSGFARALKLSVQIMRADSDVRVIAMQQGGYDTHESQLAQHVNNFYELNAGLKAFMQDVQAQGLGGRVLVLLWSEFARRIEPNANAGTDHGSAQAMVLLGDGVRPGIYGNPPSLKDADTIDGGNLRMSVDFRQLYATVLSGWLGVDATAALGANWGTIPVLL
jgi:uncharacterized protein (DUF1501 family)